MIRIPEIYERFHRKGDLHHVFNHVKPNVILNNIILHHDILHHVVLVGCIGQARESQQHFSNLTIFHTQSNFNFVDSEIKDS